MGYGFITFPIYIFQLGKSFGTQLHAKDDTLRDEAVAAMAALAKQVTKSSAGVPQLD